MGLGLAILAVLLGPDVELGVGRWWSDDCQRCDVVFVFWREHLLDDLCPIVIDGKHEDVPEEAIGVQLTLLENLVFLEHDQNVLERIDEIVLGNVFLKTLNGDASILQRVYDLQVVI